MKRCHIFAGGDLGKIADYWFPNHGGYVICADSGYKHAKKLGLVPDLLVGDFDSYTRKLPKGVEVYRSVPEKDDTDTLMAVKIAIERGYTNIYLYGALGGPRFDHAFANIQTMLYAREHGANLILIGNGTLLLQGEGEAMYTEESKRWGYKYLSVFAITETVKIKSLRGVKYPLENYEMKSSFPIGVSNEITDGQAFLDIESGLALVIQL
ncbi:MAG TPA: thiamine diphosphokinase [Ruminococcus sp.]|mgnify:CR=1 FL=1|nr:thiamine diphosphokinase [Ruminococcus sp.]